MEPLPVDVILPELLTALRGHGAAVLTAPPGTGKSTRVPPALVAAPDLLAPGHPRVLLLQPRRVAAISLARRIAEERCWQLGREVGHRVRFDSVGGAGTRLWVETEGTLTRQLLTDPYLEGVGAVILDEFHERSQHVDLALAWLTELRRTVRPDLRLVVMSATMDAAPVAGFLDDAPVLDAPATLHEVKILHRPARPRERLPDQIHRLLDEALADPDEAGDVLVFLPGVGEIEACARLLGDRDDLAVVPLHGSLPADAQRRALEPAARRKVVLATNVAETSLTIPKVRTVIDSGLARVARFAPETGLDVLRLEAISAFSATQRSGRAGRTAPGRCLRCWSRLEDRRRPQAMEPELQRCDLAGILPAVKSLHGADCAGFPWFDAPAAERLAAAEELLARLGWIDEPGAALNARGRYLVDLPLHPRLGRLLAEAVSRRCLALGLEVAALLSERDLRPRGEDRPVAAGPADLLDRRRRLHRARQLDYHPRLRAEGIDPRAAGRVEAVRKQLAGQTRRMFGEQETDDAPPAEELPGLLLAAFPDRVAVRDPGDPNRLTLLGGVKVTIPPASCLHARRVEERPGLVVAHAVQGFGGRGRSRRLLQMGADLEPERLAGLAPASLHREESLRYLPAAGRVEVAAVERYEDLVIAYRPGVAGDPEAVADCLAAGLETDWPAILAAHPGAASLVQRWTWLQEHAPDAGLPTWDAAVVRAVLREVCTGLRKRDQVMAADLLPWLAARLDWEQRRRLDAWAPERIEVPSGSRLRIDYTGDRPVLAVRIQELFGLGRTLSILAGRAPLLLHILAPNQRPIQVTDDLPSFWHNTDPRVRKDLRGRYPKHAWPEDPG